MALTTREVTKQFEQVVSQQDPFSFLVLERVIKEKAASRVTPMTPSQYLFGGRRRHEREQASLEQVENICNAMWAQLVQDLLSLQNETILYNAAKPLRQQMIRDAHQERLEQVDRDLEYFVRDRGMQQKIRQMEHEDAIVQAARNESLYKHSRKLQDLIAADELRRDVNRWQAQGDEQMRGDDAIFAREMKRSEDLHAQVMARLESQREHEQIMARITPDPSDPAYMAERNRGAQKVYSGMLRDIHDSDDDDELKHQLSETVLALAAKNAK